RARLQPRSARRPTLSNVSRDNCGTGSGTMSVSGSATAIGSATQVIDLKALQAEADVGAPIAELDRDLVGLAPVKQRIREIAAFLLVARARQEVGLTSEPPTLHMAFTGNPGTGKTTVALRMANILHRLVDIRKAHLHSIQRDDPSAQVIVHTAPRTHAQHHH